MKPPLGRYFGTVPAGVSACPLIPGLPYAGGVLGLLPGYMLWIPWVWCLYPGCLEAALLDWKCTGSLRSPGGTHTVAAGERSRERTHLHRQTNTDKRIQAGEEAQPLNPTAPSSPEPPRQLMKTATSEHRIQGGKE